MVLLGILIFNMNMVMAIFLFSFNSVRPIMEVRQKLRLMRCGAHVVLLLVKFQKKI